MQIFDDPRRLRLSGMAAAGADVQPQLRLLMLAEALAAPPTHRALDLSAETAVLCTAASEAVRRRPGWLYVMPSPAPLPVALPRNLWQAAVLCVLRCVLPAGRAAVTLQPGAGAAVAVFRAVSASGMPADTLPLLRRAAALTGGPVQPCAGLVGWVYGIERMDVRTTFCRFYTVQDKIDQKLPLAITNAVL